MTSLRNLMKEKKCDQHMNSLEWSAWKLFKQVVHNFLGSKKSENYVDDMQEMLILKVRVSNVVKDTFLLLTLGLFS